MLKRILAVITLLTSFSVISMSAVASVPVRQAAGEKKDIYLDSGVFVGGRDRGPLQLENVRHSVQKSSGLERVVFDVGTAAAHDAGRPGFFHIAIQKKPRRVVIDLQDISGARISAAQVSKVLQTSPYFSKAFYYGDRANHSLTIELPMKTNAEIEVFELVSTDKPGRIVMDVRGQ
jgi:hypothetical protein